MTPLETRLRSLRQPGRSGPSPAELRRRSVVRRRRRVFSAAAVAVPFIAVALAVFVAADPGDPRSDQEASGSEDPGRSGAEADVGNSEDGKRFDAARLASIAAHEMQVEGELAVLYASSKSEDDRAAWEAQAAPSDKAAKDFRDAMSAIDVDKLDSRTRASMSLIERTADGAVRARSIVDGGVTDWPATYNVYLAVSKSFVDAGVDLANSTSAPELNAKARSWAMVLQLEAAIADQKVLLTGIFSTGYFRVDEGGAAADPLYDALEQLVSDEENHARTVERFGEDEIVRKVRDARSGNDVSAADDDRQRALDGPDGRDLAVSVDIWRINGGKKLDRVRDAQVDVADSILGSIADGAEDGGSLGGDDRPLVAVGVVLGLVALVLAFLLGRRKAGGGRRAEPQSQATD